MNTEMVDCEVWPSPQSIVAEYLPAPPTPVPFESGNSATFPLRINSPARPVMVTGPALTSAGTQRSSRDSRRRRADRVVGRLAFMGRLWTGGELADSVSGPVASEN